MAITDFLLLNISKDELATTLKVLHLFKEQESIEEWGAIPFHCWAKLEQLEEFLEHMVNDKPLQADTIRYIERTKKEKKPNTIEGYHQVYIDKIEKFNIPLPPGKIEPIEWKPTATDVACKLVKCKGCHQQLPPAPCDRWYFNVIRAFIRIFYWR